MRRRPKPSTRAESNARKRLGANWPLSAETSRLPSMRRTLLLGLAVLPGILAAAAYGCGSSEPPIEDLCGWLNDPNNCYRAFGADLNRPTMGSPANGLRCTNLSLDPAQAHPPTTPQLGQFVSNTMLDMCFLQAGGIISFDTPLDFAKMPSPIMISMINSDATTCGTVSYTNTDNFTLNVTGDAPAVDGGALAPGQVMGGQFSYIATGAGRSTATATCGITGQTGFQAHYFNELQIAKCTPLKSSVPAAYLYLDKGGYDAMGNQGTGGNYGAAKFQVFYPPTTPGADGTFNNVPAVEVDYFTCLIPPPPPLCADGVQDGGETDVDCGGVTKCARCMMGMKCITKNDCGGNMACCPIMGLSQCTPGGCGGTTSSSGGG